MFLAQLVELCVHEVEHGHHLHGRDLTADGGEAYHVAEQYRYTAERLLQNYVTQHCYFTEKHCHLAESLLHNRSTHHKVYDVTDQHRQAQNACPAERVTAERLLHIWRHEEYYHINPNRHSAEMLMHEIRHKCNHVTE